MTVVAGVIEREGRVLICQRRRDSGAHPLKWEFPGGKAEAGEDPAEALARELWEELRIRVATPIERMRYEYSYPGRPPILLIFFEVTEFAGKPENQVFERIVWEPWERLVGYDFLAGDPRFVTSWQSRVRGGTL